MKTKNEEKVIPENKTKTSQVECLCGIIIIFDLEVRAAFCKLSPSVFK
jgi:hypothetical protein